MIGTLVWAMTTAWAGPAVDVSVSPPAGAARAAVVRWQSIQDGAEPTVLRQTWRWSDGSVLPEVSDHVAVLRGDPAVGDGLQLGPDAPVLPWGLTWAETWAVGWLAWDQQRVELSRRVDVNASLAVPATAVSGATSWSVGLPAWREAVSLPHCPDTGPGTGCVALRTSGGHGGVQWLMTWVVEPGTGVPHRMSITGVPSEQAVLPPVVPEAGAPAPEPVPPVVPVRVQIELARAEAPEARWASGASGG